MTVHYVFILVRVDKSVDSVWFNEVKAKRYAENRGLKILKRKVRDA